MTSQRLGSGRFGSLLRSMRERELMTQEDLAERSGLSARGIHKLEAGRVESPRSHTVLALSRGLGLDDDDRQRLIEAARPADTTSTQRWPGLVGRDRDVESIMTMLGDSDVRVLTLVGLAGVGKTRLALAVADELRRRGTDVWLVHLADVHVPALMLDAVADVVEAASPALDDIATRLDGRRGVLVVDNLEQLDGVDTVLEPLIDQLPDIAVLATSRTPIGIALEHEFAVRPLPPPGPGLDIGELSANPAVALLVARIRTADSSFQLDVDSADVVVEVCRRLDGVPLAIELAAGQWRVLGGQGVLGTLRDNPLDLADISGRHDGAHRSVRAALATTLDLLAADFRATLSDLSVFQGGWTIDAAEQVAGTDELLHHLDRLLALGLVEAADTDAGRRFSMVPIVRSFAAERARATGTSELAAKRHAEYFQSLLPPLAPGEPAPPDVDHRHQAEIHNLRAALHWCLDHDSDAGLALTLALSRPLIFRGRSHEALDWFERFLPSASSGELRRFALMLAAGHAVTLRQTEKASSWCNETLAESRRHGDRLGEAQALGTLGMIEDPPAAVPRLTAAAELADQAAHPYTQVWCLTNLHANLFSLGRLTEAVATIDEALALAEQHPSAYLRTFQRIARASTIGYMGDDDTALRELESLDHDDFVHTGPQVTVAYFTNLALCQARLGDAAAASAAAERALRAAHEDDMADTMVTASTGAGHAALVDDDCTRARQQFRSVIELARTGTSWVNRVDALVGLAALSGDMASAALAISAARAVADEIGMVIAPAIQSRIDSVERRWEAADADAWQACLDQHTEIDYETARVQLLAA